jgi:hypothetical protein
MRMWKPTVQSLFGLLGRAEPSTEQLDEAMDGIQETMLAALGPNGQSRHPTVSRRIEYATDLNGLWHLRPDLMQALSSLHGEAHALSLMREITAEFDGMLPSGMATRPSPLGD